MTDTNHKILIVEDDAALLEMYKIKFQESGLNLVTASDGLAGLELVKKEKPTLILLDIMMPKMDGFAVLSEIKKDPATKSITVLMLSNLGQQSDVEKGSQLGAADYIVKASMTPTQVVEKVKEFLK
ncbi:MAG: response regulator [Candidatus Buchananbacteria bacterium]|nr:response regulator [Candidatus Buchananbacteria bacterium]